MLLQHEGPGHSLEEAAGRHDTASCAQAGLRRGDDDLATTNGGWKRGGRQGIIADEAGDFFDDISGLLNVETPARNVEIPGLARILEGEAKLLDHALQLCRLDVEACQASDVAAVEGDALIVGWSRARNGGGRDFAAAIFANKREREVQPVNAAGRVHAALETVAGVRDDAGRAACACRAQRIKPGAFDEDVRGAGRDGCRLPAHHAAEAYRATIISDDAHILGEVIGLAVERFELFTCPAEACNDGALKLLRIIDMKRARAVIGDVIRNVDEQRFRRDADRFQALLQPFWRRTILHTAHERPGKDRAGFRRFKPDIDGAWIRPLHLLDRVFEEASCPCSGKVAGNALHTEPVRTVRRDFEVDDRVCQAERFCGRCADFPVAIKVRDPIMVLAGFKLLGRA